jgi:hypothetical protein
MAHVFYLEEAPAYINDPTGQLDLGRQWQSMAHMAASKYKMDGPRDGYCTPLESVLMLKMVRVKKECIASLVHEHMISPYVTSKPTPLWVIMLPKRIYNWFKNRGWGVYHKDEWNVYTTVGTGLMLLNNAAHKLKYMGIPLRGVDAITKEDFIKREGREPVYITKPWSCKYFLGWLPDRDVGMGEEL